MEFCTILVPFFKYYWEAQKSIITYSLPPVDKPNQYAQHEANICLNLGTKLSAWKERKETQYAVKFCKFAARYLFRILNILLILLLHMTELASYSLLCFQALSLSAYTFSCYHSTYCIIWNLIIFSVYLNLVHNLFQYTDMIWCSDWLRAGRLRGRGSSPGRVKNFHFSMSSRPALGSTQPHIQWVPVALSRG
jgi:hypothetical protein